VPKNMTTPRHPRLPIHGGGPVPACPGCRRGVTKFLPHPAARGPGSTPPRPPSGQCMCRYGGPVRGVRRLLFRGGVDARQGMPCHGVPLSSVPACPTDVTCL
jgi:hypothetical protein